MEAELLKSKTELMMLNNHLLEAVQKRLELSLELEAWKVNLFEKVVSYRAKLRWWETHEHMGSRWRSLEK